MTEQEIEELLRQAGEWFILTVSPTARHSKTDQIVLGLVTLIRDLRAQLAKAQDAAWEEGREAAVRRLTDVAMAKFVSRGSPHNPAGGRMNSTARHLIDQIRALKRKAQS